MAVSGDNAYLEVHRDVYRRLTTAISYQTHELARHFALENQIDWVMADREEERRAGVARRISFTSE
jgi:hypothetical protein